MRALFKADNLFFKDPRLDNAHVRFTDTIAEQILPQLVTPAYVHEARQKTRSSYVPGKFHEDLILLSRTVAGMVDHPEFDADCWHSTLAEAVDVFAFDEAVKPMKLYDVNLKPSSAAGRKYGSRKRGDVHYESVDVAQTVLDRYCMFGPDYDAYSAYTVYARTQFADIFDPRTRGIFGAQDHNLRIECSLTYPFNDTLLTKSSPSRSCHYPIVYGWSLDDYTNFRRHWHLPWTGGQFAGFDWSKWDRSLEHEEITDAFDEMRCLFHPSGHKRLEFSRDYYCRTPVITGDVATECTTGVLYELFGYGPSGSGFTHIVNNVCNQRRTRYLMKRLDIDASVFTAQDDLLLAGFGLDRITQPRIDELIKPWPLAKLDVTTNPPTGDPDAVEFLSYTTPYGRIHRDAFRMYAWHCIQSEPM